MPIDPLSAGIELIPLAGDQLRAFRAKNEIKTLYKDVEADVRRTQLPPGSTDQVTARIRALNVDPRLCWGLTRMLEGDVQVRSAMHKRLAELLRFEDPALDEHELAKTVLGAIERNLHRAKRDDREAGHLEGELTRGEIRELRGELREVLDGGGTPLTGTEAAAISGGAMNLVRALAELQPDQARMFERLEATDSQGATRLQQAIAAGGPERVAELIEAPQDWLENGTARLWESAARLAASVGRAEQAQRGYERAAEHAGVEDRARALVRAGRTALLRGETAAGDALIARARGVDADNPAVLLHDATICNDSGEALELLARVVPADDEQGAMCELLRASQLVTRREYGEARAAVTRARALQADDDADELDAVIDLAETQGALHDGQEPDTPRMQSAGSVFERLVGEAARQQRLEAAGTLAGHAAQAYALAGSMRDGNRVLDLALADERMCAATEARRALAQGAMLLRRFDTALALVPPSEEPEDLLARAAARIIGGSSVARREAVAEITPLLDTSGPERDQAAFLILCVAAEDTSMPWDERAERLVDQQRPVAAAFLRAERLSEEGDFEGAEARLRAHSQDADALRFLAHLAERQDKHDVFLRLAETLVERTGSASDRILFATALARDGQQPRAIEQLRAIARDPNAPPDERIRAFSRAAALLQEARSFRELERLAREWAKSDSDPYPRWLVLLSLAARFDHAGAYAAWHELDEPKADSEGRAQLLGEIFMLAAEPVEGLRMLCELSDAHGRPETLEAAVILGSLRIHEPVDEEMPDELAKRVGESFETFPERFPESKRLRTITLDPEDPVGSILAELGEQLGHRADRAPAMYEGVRTGGSATAMLAAVSNRSVGEVMMSLPALPLSYPDDAFERLDRADAAAAYDAGGAVWDESALFIAGGLGEPLTRMLWSALPASRLARATLDAAAGDATAPRGEHEGRLFVQDGVLATAERDEEQQRAEDLRRKGTLDLARELQLLPSPKDRPADDGTLRALAEIAGKEGPVAVRAWAETLLGAHAHGMAIYSDDRGVRAGARQLGIPAFGTLAMVDVLAERGQIADADAQRVRERLLEHGAWGLRPTPGELERMARDTGWQPTGGLHAALADRGTWLSLGARWADVLLGFLDRVAAEAPEHMDRWTHRAVDAVSEATGGDYEANAAALLLVAISPLAASPRISDQGLSAMLESIREMTYFRYFRPGEDLLVRATRMLLSNTQDSREQAMLLKGVLRRLGPEDQALLRKRFVR